MGNLHELNGPSVQTDLVMHLADRRERVVGRTQSVSMKKLKIHPLATRKL